MTLTLYPIQKLKKLSLREVKLPPTNSRLQEVILAPIEADKPPTLQEVAFSNIVALNPLILSLVERLNLVDCPPEEIANKNEIIAIANRILKPEKSYSKTQIVGAIQDDIGIDIARAERGFFIMLEVGAILRIKPEPGLYYLAGSTPF